MSATLVLDVVAWDAVLERADAHVPLAFRPGYGLLTGDDEIADARTRADAHLRERRLLVPAADRAGEVLEPSLRAAVDLLAQAPVRASARGWAGQTAVVTELAVVPTAGDLLGVALTRLRRVDTAQDPTVVDEGRGVEVAVLSGQDVLDAIWRCVPPAVRTTGIRALDGDRDGDRDPVLLPVEDVTALARALRAEHDASGATASAVASRVVELVVEAAGLPRVPDALADLVDDFSGAVSVTITASGAGWHGLWLYGHGRLVAVNPAAPDGVVALRTTSGADLRTDLLLALTGALTRAGVR